MANIFVIDDDEQLLRMVGLMLERGGHAPTLVGNPKQGLAQIKQDMPDLVVLDVMMPGMSGHDVCRALRADPATAHLPVLILTARAQEVDRQTALQSGANDYLSKPVTSRELLEQIDRLLRTNDTKPFIETPSTLTTIYSLIGGVGRTTLAINLAISLQTLTGQEVVLVDLSTTGGQAAMHLRLAPERGWEELLNKQNITWESVSSTLLAHTSGIKLLPAPATPQSPLMPGKDVMEAILRTLRSHVQFIVVDTPAAFSPATAEAIRTADRALHLVTADVVAVQTALRMERALLKNGLIPQDQAFVLTQPTAKPQLKSEMVERGLSASLTHQVPFDPQQARALAQGIPLSMRLGKEHSVMKPAVDEIARGLVTINV